MLDVNIVFGQMTYYDIYINMPKRFTKHIGGPYSMNIGQVIICINSPKLYVHFKNFYQIKTTPSKPIFYFLVHNILHIVPVYPYCKLIVDYGERRFLLIYVKQILLFKMYPIENKFNFIMKLKNSRMPE